jgi:predicted metal-dependent peptidase
MAINPLLREAGMALPVDGLYDSHTPPRSAEEIYPEITDEMVLKYACWGEIGDFTGDDPDAEMERITVLLSDAYRRSQGKLPAGLERLILDRIAPPIPWRNILENYVVSAVRESYSSTRFNRRFLRNKIYLPALHSTKLNLVVAVDTSGSISGDQLSEIGAVIEDIRIQVPKMVVSVIYCDAKVQRREIFEEGDACVLKPKGGGGTDFRPVFEEVKRDDTPPDVLLYLTDGYGTYPERNEIEFPVIWVYFRNKDIEIDYW